MQVTPSAKSFLHEADRRAAPVEAGPSTSSSAARSERKRSGFSAGDHKGRPFAPPSLLDVHVRDPEQSVDGLRGGFLDLQEGISTPRPDLLRLQPEHPRPHDRLEDPRTGCLRWPEHLRLLNETTGEIVLGRCRATNLCRYCQTLYVLETVEMLTLDAIEHAPTLWAVLTAREHLTRRDTYRHLEKLLRSCRRRWPSIQWFVQVEFQRRGALHLNLLIKGVDIDNDDQLRSHLIERWCSRVDAEPVGQWLGRIEEAGGVVRYLQKTLSHGLKREQAPPIGWRGHRTSQTRGYLVRPAAQMRDEARAALRLKRELWRAIQSGHQAHEAELVAQLAVTDQAEHDWRLYAMQLKKAGAGPRSVQLGQRV